MTLPDLSFFWLSLVMLFHAFSITSPLLSLSRTKVHYTVPDPIEFGHEGSAVSYRDLEL